MTFAEDLQSWHDFYLTAGAASATLVGLLFVGLSLHIRVVVSHFDVRSLARVTLTDFFVIVLISLAVLIPRATPTDLTFWLGSVGIGSIALLIRPGVQAIRNRAARALGLRVLATRFGISVLAFVAIIGAAILFATGDYHDGFNALVPTVVILLVMAVRNTWDLLVTVADKPEAPGQ